MYLRGKKKRERALDNENGLREFIRLVVESKITGKRKERRG